MNGFLQLAPITNSTNGQPSPTTQIHSQLSPNNYNGYITTNVAEPNQLLHNPNQIKSANIIGNQPSQLLQPLQPLPPLLPLQPNNSLPTQYPFPPSLQSILANPPPHPSQLLSGSFGQLPAAPLPSFVDNFKPTQTINNGLSLPLLPNILDINQTQNPLQPPSPVNQNIVNANNASLIQQAQKQKKQNQNQNETAPVISPTPNQDRAQNSNPDLAKSDSTTNVSDQKNEPETSKTSKPTKPTPTLINVADGVIPGVEAGLYWYHPQIDQSAVLLPVDVNDGKVNP